jgi:hypothetical protein
MRKQRDTVQDSILGHDDFCVYDGVLEHPDILLGEQGVVQLVTPDL